ncbi:MAG TPA: prepilin-type N-terminal cleavage/methylation domain-containing protein [Candidatus Paceibacterota bacterium]|nr:prepilin-type N-terminal cleavage/methylation domain-containing protein [Verrucomicrobiota bacterium]HSA09318.1 prepilin-type N-terminal cleavage/methylation domain-containing protein [Candidatus Paceibacterota bacterium]
MKLPLTTAHGPRTTGHATKGFTLVEILVTVSLLAFIILGLYATFSQVQRAFRMSMSQVDKLEAGRAVTEMLPRDFEQAAPSDHNAVNYAALVIPNSAPLTQPLPGTTLLRTNLLQDCFVLLRQNQTWTGVGYCVRTNDANGRLWLPECGPGQLGVGSLYRYCASTNVLRSDGLPADPSQLYLRFRDACASGSVASLDISNRVCDGVIHFHLRGFATNGFPIVYGSWSGTNVACFRRDAITTPAFFTIIQQATTLLNDDYPDNLAGCYFWSNAVPAALELELGILDQHTWDRYSSMPTAAARLAYLQRSDVSGRIHLFRQRIPIRNVDPSVYQ